MAWIPLHALLDGASVNRGVAYGPDMDRVTLAGDSLALAGGLQGLGARRVGLWFDDAASLAVALLACWRVGATAVLAPDNRAATRNALAEQAEGLDLWLTDGDVAGVAATPAAATVVAPGPGAGKDGAPTHTAAAAAGGGDGAPRLPIRTIEQLMAGASALSGGPLDLDSGAVVLCTSGSSGQPKQIRKRWRQLAAEIEALEALWHWSEPLAGSAATSSASNNSAAPNSKISGSESPDSAGEPLRPVCVLGSVSPQHMYGLPFRLLWPLCSGRLVARRQLVYPEALQHASLPHADFVWIASPALLKRLGTSLDHAALRGGLRQIVSSGGPLPGEISDMLARDLGCRPCEIYGSSETGAVAWRQGDTAWRPLPGAEVGVSAGIDGNAAAVDAPAGSDATTKTDAADNPPPQALWIRSPWLMPGETFQSNDAVQLTADGFRLLGRMDRIVKIEEKRIALPAVEQALALHPYVNEARVDLVAGEQRLSALIALTAQGIHALRNGGRAALAQALRTHLAPTQEALAVPRHLRFVRELPWNAQGKLSRADFERALARPRWPTEVPSAPTQDASRMAEPALPAHASRVQSAATTGVESVDAPPEARRYQLEIPLDLRQFDGHFATTPVVPGVAQIDWAMNLARRDLSTELNFCGADALKFQRLIRPGDQIDLALRWEPAKGRLYFEFRAGDQPCSSGRILTQARHGPA